MSEAMNDLKKAELAAHTYDGLGAPMSDPARAQGNASAPVILRSQERMMTDSKPIVTDAMVEAASAAYAHATGYYVEFHKGLRSESSDKIRRGMRAALSALPAAPMPGVNASLIEEYRNLVKTGLEYAASELRLAPTSAFEIYMGHFRDIGKDIETALSALPTPAAGASAEAVAWRGLGEDNVSEVTDRQDIANQWERDGIEVTPLYARFTRCDGCDGHECISSCMYPPTSAPPPSPAQGTVERPREVAWLIERKENSATVPRWYAEKANGWHWWTTEAYEAKRFASEAEAKAYPAYQMIATDTSISVTEHVFVGTVERAEPVAWGLFSSSAGCLSTTTEERVAKRWAAESAKGISVKALFLYAIPPDSDAVRALIDKPLTYDWNGHKDMPVQSPEQPDGMVAGRVRMLMRDQLNHEEICTLARDRIMGLSKRLAEVRAALSGQGSRNDG